MLFCRDIREQTRLFFSHSPVVFLRSRIRHINFETCALSCTFSTPPLSTKANLATVATPRAAIGPVTHKLGEGRYIPRREWRVSAAAGGCKSSVCDRTGRATSGLGFKITTPLICVARGGRGGGRAATRRPRSRAQLPAKLFPEIKLCCSSAITCFITIIIMR
ncbi:hypothetical protein EVAR_85263_1 [Eumeta japonica]|uniref:Uncharacterized protein n=1 Tax=Eumeta variegata TaxID=151549 RepID=A0A4C1V6W0_EUMVA|nr:hypothetical protein EVAR_85263_1 [Eumeta japonica]